MENYRWGIIGLGHIAHEFAHQFPKTQTIYGVAAHDQKRAASFAKQFGVRHVYASYAELFADPAIDIVYVATTHNFHYANIKAALNAGKHVLAEKSITLNAAQLDELTALAQAKHLILMEAQTIYHMPLYPSLVEYAASHTLGQLKTINVLFGSHAPTDPSSRLMNPQLAGGALLDIGVYALSFARRFMTAPPQLVATQMTPTTTGVDDSSTMLLTNDHGEQVTIALNLQTKMPKVGVVAYQNGFFTVDQYPRSQGATFTTPDLKPHLLEAGNTNDALAYEALDMVQAVASGNNPTLQWTRDVMAIMTAVREQWGFKYPGEA